MPAGPSAQSLMESSAGSAGSTVRGGQRCVGNVEDVGDVAETDGSMQARRSRAISASVAEDGLQGAPGEPLRSRAGRLCRSARYLPNTRGYP